MKLRRAKSENINNNVNMDNLDNGKFNRDGNAKLDQPIQTTFPITKPVICSTNPKFPYQDIRHYIDPCCDYATKFEYGYTAQFALNKINCHFPEYPKSHSRFKPSMDN